MQRFDLLGELPAPRTTTVLEASAGTGKTFALAGLVTRMVAEGVATLDQMLLVTFSRAASQELRERVRHQIAHALLAFDGDPAQAGDNQVVQHLLDATDEQCAERRDRLRDALAAFDSATIATTHQFCKLVLESLGVAGDADSGVTLVENLDDLVREITDDVYLAHFGRERDDPPIDYQTAKRLARDVVANTSAQLRPENPDPDSSDGARLRFAKDVLAELEVRKRRRGILGYDDLLSRLATALDGAESPARARMHRRWPIVMVDEFQDTDPVQWNVINRAFHGFSTLILIGDPKQAIYAFRGGDIVTYLQAAESAGDRKTLGVNWRSDGALVDRLQVILHGAELGDPRIVVHKVEAHRAGGRLTGAPRDDPLRLRVLTRSTLGHRGTRPPGIDILRSRVGKDLAADIGGLLSSDAMFDGRPVRPQDVAVIVEQHKDARTCFRALTDEGIPAVYTGDSDVLESEAAADWLMLLEAFDQPHRSGLVRAAAATMFFGETAQTLAEQGDSLTDRVAETIREWAGHVRERGVAAVLEAAKVHGMSDRLLSRRGGERQMTDLAHVTQLLQDTAHREGHSLPALRDWLRKQREDSGGAAQRYRRLDSDAAAVQIMTVWASKGLQYPIVYLPFAFNRYVPERDVILFHDEDGARCLHIGGKDSPDRRRVEELGRKEAAGDGSRLTYVAMTRAQSQVVAWWAPSHDEPNGGLSRLIRDRIPGQARVRDRCEPARISDDEALARFREWEAAGGPVIEEVPAEPMIVPGVTTRLVAEIAERHFHRRIDTTWRRTSYSGLIRSVNPAGDLAADQMGVSSEPEVPDLDDESSEAMSVTSPAAGSGLVSPMADLPMGAKFGSLVHAVLETADPMAGDLVAELQTHIERHWVWWPVTVPAADLAAALIPLHDTPLGPLADGLTLRGIGLPDRLREMDFEFPLAGGDLRTTEQIRLADVGELLRKHLHAGDPLARYADRLCGDGLGAEPLRGYLSGSIDAVLRIPDRSGVVGQRYLVVDYKTNWLGEPNGLLTAGDYSYSRMAEAMLHSDYPLQALLYSVVLHRFLRWRLPGYHPGQHLGGVLYLFLRGMCGRETPLIDGHPTGVFGWQPPAALVTELSDLLDGRRALA